MAMIFSSDRDSHDEDGSMFGPKMGSWWVYSKLDPRWNTEGRGYGLVTQGGPSEINDWISKCESKFGPKPEDLSIGFMKD